MIRTHKHFLSNRPKTSILQRKPEIKKSVSFADSFGFSLQDVKMFDRLEDFSHILFDLANLDCWKYNILDCNIRDDPKTRTQFSNVSSRDVDTLTELLNAKTYSCTPLISPKFSQISPTSKVNNYTQTLQRNTSAKGVQKSIIELTKILFQGKKRS